MPDLENPISTYMAITKAASSDKSFVNFDLGLAPEAMADMDALKVTETSCYDNFGETDSLRNDIARYLESQGNAPDLAGRVADVLDQVAKDATAAKKSQACFLSLRGFTPTEEFDVPRWHVDGWFFEPTENDRQQKIALSLKGPKTLLNDLTDENRVPFINTLRSFEGDSPENRRALEKFVAPQNTHTALPGQATIFTVGDIKDAAVHSEPPIHSERLFMSVVPGSRAQIAELRARWERPATTYANTSQSQQPQTPQMK